MFVLWSKLCDISVRTECLILDSPDQTESMWTFSSDFFHHSRQVPFYISRCAVTLATVQGSNLFGQRSIYARAQPGLAGCLPALSFRIPVF